MSDDEFMMEVSDYAWNEADRVQDAADDEVRVALQCNAQTWC